MKEGRVRRDREERQEDWEEVRVKGLVVREDPVIW